MLPKLCFCCFASSNFPPTVSSTEILVCKGTRKFTNRFDLTLADYTHEAICNASFRTASTCNYYGAILDRGHGKDRSREACRRHRHVCQASELLNDTSRAALWSTKRRLKQLHHITAVWALCILVRKQGCGFLSSHTSTWRRRGARQPGQTAPHWLSQEHQLPHDPPFIVTSPLV